MRFWRQGRGEGADGETRDTSPTDAELKVRATLEALERAATRANDRGVGMDAKASILLVIAGILTTTSIQGDGLIARLAAIAAIAAALAALLSLWPVKVKGIHPETLIERITGRDELFPDYEHWMLAMEAAAAVAREKRLETRGLLLAIGFVLAFAAMVLAVFSLLHDGNWFAAWLGSFAHPKVTPQPSPSAH